MSDPYELVQLRSGAWGIRSHEFDEICHPGVGPRAEAEALYVRGLDLPRRIAEHASRGSRPEAGLPFVVWDIGLGGAANATAVMEAAGSFAVDLQVVSFDRTLGQLEFALRHADQLACFGRLAPAAATLLNHGTNEFILGNATIRWRCVLGDFPALVASASARDWPKPHAILFDPHSPAANPEMWTQPLFHHLYACLHPDRPCALATYSRGTAHRTALLIAGFFVGTGGSTEAKEETTLASNRRELVGTPLGQRWLERAHRSRAAEPWTSPPYGGRPLTSETWERLRLHPQFLDRGVPS